MSTRGPSAEIMGEGQDAMNGGPRQIQSCRYGGHQCVIDKPYLTLEMVQQWQQLVARVAMRCYPFGNLRLCLLEFHAQPSSSGRCLASALDRGQLELLHL